VLGFDTSGAALLGWLISVAIPIAIVIEVLHIIFRGHKRDWKAAAEVAGCILLACAVLTLATTTGMTGQVGSAIWDHI
jgi:hypothetical protein